MKQKMNWQQGKPQENGLHFVAVQVGDGAGWYDFLEWDGEKWSCRPTEEIIAFMSLQDMIGQLKIEWPGAENENAEKEPELSDDDFDFKEI